MQRYYLFADCTNYTMRLLLHKEVGSIPSHLFVPLCIGMEVIAKAPLGAQGLLIGRIAHEFIEVEITVSHPLRYQCR